MDAKSSKSKASFYRKRDTICNTSLEDCDFFKECTAFEPEELPVTPPGEDSEFVEDTDYDMQSNNSDEDDLDDFSEFFGKLLHDPQFSADNDLVEALQSLEDDATDNFLADDDEFFDCEDLSSEEYLENDPPVSDFVKPLYHGAKITFGAAVTLLMVFTQKFHLSGAALSMLIEMLNIFLPTGHLLPRSLYHFKKLFTLLSPSPKLHYFCKECFIKVDKTSNCCLNPDCKQSSLPASDTAFKKSYFLEFDIQHQIKSIFQRAGMLEMLSHRFQRISTGISDIYDGSLYKSFSSPGSFLSNVNHISFLWNTDGVPVFKSSKSSLWPLLYSINELPFKERVKKENVLINGLWFGESHPNMLLFLPPQLETMNDIRENGIKINDKVTLKGMILCGTCDMPAKASVLNMCQFNAFYGCPKCTQRGETVMTESGGNVRSFPFKPENPEGPSRTHIETVQHAKNVLESTKKEPICGIKGPSALLILPSFNIVKGVAVDYMHGVLLGVMKLCLNLWLDKSHKKEPFSIHSNIENVENRLLAIKPPNHISRAPRSVKSTLSYWKASEFRSFLLYYFVPVMKGYLTDTYYQHFYLLVHSIHLLLKTEISENDIQTAKRFLRLFVYLFERLYKIRYQTINIHSLVHLPATVEELGPLFVYSLFHFEDKNGYILKMIHGTQNICFQLASAVSASNFLPLLMEETIQINSQEEKFIKKFNGSYHGSQFVISPRVNGIGSFSSYKPSKEEQTVFFFKYRCMFDLELTKTFQSIKVNGFTIRSRQCTKETRRESTTVMLCNGQYFSIDRFACFTAEDEMYFVAFGHYFEELDHDSLSVFKKCLKSNELPMTMVKNVKKDDNLSVIAIEDIGEQCINMGSHIAHFPNILESD